MRKLYNDVALSDNFTGDNDIEERYKLLYILWDSRFNPDMYTDKKITDTCRRLNVILSSVGECCNSCKCKEC